MLPYSPIQSVIHALVVASKETRDDKLRVSCVSAGAIACTCLSYAVQTATLAVLIVI